MWEKKELAPLTYPKYPPDKNVSDYIQSKIECEQIRKYPEWDLPRQEPATDLVAAKRELYDVEVLLEEKRKESQVLRQKMNEQWKELARKEDKLKNNFIKFNKFVKENQEKKDRAERKIGEEVALQEKRDKEIKELTEKYERMLGIKIQMEYNIQEHRMYEDFLQDVVKSTKEFKTVNAILDRYETLADARKELAERQDRELTALEAARNEMIKLTEEKMLEIMGFNNQIADLQDRYDVAKNKAMHWEGTVTRIKNIAAAKMSELHQVRECCWNMYLQMCKRKEMDPEYRKDDIENQLIFIKHTLSELKRITMIAKRQVSRGGGSVKTQRVSIKSKH